MSDYTMSAAMQQAREVIANESVRHHIGTTGGTAAGSWWGCRCGATGRVEGARGFAEVEGHRHVADAILAALVDELGLREDCDVDWCESEKLIDFGFDVPQWVRCRQPGDHEDDHKGVDGGSWPRGADDPPKRREWRLTTDWQEDEG